MLAVGSLLFKGDSNSCNTILVAKYPSNVCPRYISRLALHLQDNKAFHKPTGSPFISDLSDSFEFVEHPDKPAQQFDKLHFHQRNDHVIDSNSRLRWHFDRVQDALNQANEAVEASKCDHGLVQVSLHRLQAALDVLGQDIPSAEASSGRPSHGQIRTHRRSTSVAYEALAFQ